MKLSELKEHIINHQKIDFPLFFICDKENFLIKSYINAILTNLNLNLIKLDELSDLNVYKTDIFNEGNNLYIYILKKGETIKKEEIENEKIIIECNEPVDDETLIQIKFPEKLENWQIEEYVKSELPGLNGDDVKWLCQITKDPKTKEPNIDRLDLEVQKLNIFNKNEQEQMFKLMNKEDAFRDLNDLNIFNLTYAIMRRDMNTINDVVTNIDHIDIEGTGLVTLLLRQFKDLINVTFGSSSYENLGMSEKQYKAISKNKNVYTKEKLIDVYEFLNGIDYKLKTGLLDLTNNQLDTYIIFNVLR